MTILQINKLYAPAIGGIETVVQQLAEWFVYHGESRVLAVRNGVGRGSVGNMNGVMVRRTGSVGRVRSMPLSFSFFYWLAKECKTADVVHVHYPFPLAAMALWLVRPKKPLIITWHSSVVRQRLLNFFVHPFVRWTLSRAAKIVVTFPDAVSVFKELAPFANKCVITPLGIDDAPVRLHITFSAPQPGEHPLFVFAGRFIYYKGLPELITAFAAVSRGTLYLVGDGPLRKTIAKLVARKGLAARVKVIATRDGELLRFYISASDVVMFPSTHPSEVFGLVQLEAMIVGKPIINTALKTGVPWVARDGQEAVTVPPGDVPALTRAMEQLGNDEPLRVRLGQAGRERVVQEFTLAKMQAAYYDLYHYVSSQK